MLNYSLFKIKLSNLVKTKAKAYKISSAQAKTIIGLADQYIKGWNISLVTVLKKAQCKNQILVDTEPKAEKILAITFLTIFSEPLNTFEIAKTKTAQ